MKNEKAKEMISIVYNSVIGIDGFTTEEMESIKYKIDDKTFEIKKYDKNIKRYSFDISNPEMKLTFKVLISKVPNSFFGRDKSKYITNIRIHDKPSHYSYSSSLKEEFWMLSWLDDTLDIQKKLFNTIESKIISIESKKENDRYNQYITELKKSVDKVASRDDKINDIFN